MLNYPYYYHRTIQSYPIGFKLVLGGTGLGKTSGIRDVICMPEYQERKFIYVANRVQLLEEMGQSLTQHHPGCYVLLRRDLEIVLHTLKTSNSDFYELLRDSLFLDNLDRWNQRSVLRRIDLAAVKRSCKALEEMMQETQGMTLPRLLEEQADEHAHLVLNAFKSALLAANNKSSNAPSYERLADHPVIQSLFPCIAFKRRPEVRLMLVTLQKALYGFFDGRQTLNLTRLEDADGGYVIFLDEFDFLENDLVGLICRAPQINNPFRLVEFFYRAMAQHKLPLETYPQPLETYPPNIRKRILGIVDDIEQLRQASLLFPTINQFTSSLPQRAATSRRKTSGEAKASPAIFRTRHIISTDPLYLQQTNRSFDLVSEPAPSTHSAFHLFDVVSHACEQILLLFKELERANEDIIHREMLRHCFQDTRFAEDIRLISQFSPPHHEQSTQLGTLLDAGYSLYDIHDLQQRTDRAEVEVRHYGMNLTPEMILRALAEHNLVFGLSATADIQRHVHNFNLDWLSQQITVIPVDETDMAIIRDLNEQKAKARNNHLNMVVLEDLDPHDDYQQRLGQFLSALAEYEEFGEDTRSGHLKHRVQLFFSALLWMCTHAKERSTHLLFLNTFQQIKFVFDYPHPPDEHLFEITKRLIRWFDVYEITIQGRQFTVVFYNTKVANTIYQNQLAQGIFDALFWEDHPVIVVTQYPSAGNGVNLQYRLSEDSKDEQDFTHIGLLEAPYFYFSKLDTNLPEDEQIAAMKENIWYQAKLFAGKPPPNGDFARF